MIILIYLVLGIIQGITEPIPISSSGHLLILQNLFNFNEFVDFELLATSTNLGSLLAIIMLYKEEIIGLKKNTNYFSLIIIGTIPAIILGLILKKYNFFHFLENNIKFVGIALLITALFLYLIKDCVGNKGKDQITIKDSIVVGLFQALALIPGISRSGSTIVGSLLMNFKRETAYDFSFMLYIPISIAVSIVGFKNMINLTFNELSLYIISLIMSFYFTYIFTKWFKNIVKNGKLIYFVIYCMIVGILIII